MMPCGVCIPGLLFLFLLPWVTTLQSSPSQRKRDQTEEKRVTQSTHRSTSQTMAGVRPPRLLPQRTPSPR